MSTKLTTDQIITEFKKILSLTPEEKIDLDARLLAFKFMSLIEEAMNQKGLTRAQLAKRIGTSKSYITQLFRGDKAPNWRLLSKIAQVLEIDFFICTKDYVNSLEKDDYIKAVFKFTSYKHIEAFSSKEIYAA